MVRGMHCAELSEFAKFDDVVMAANTAVIAAPLRGSKRAVVRWMIAVEEGEKEWERGLFVELEGLVRVWFQDPIAAPVMLMFLVHELVTPARHRPAALINGGIAEHLGWTQRYYWGAVTPI